VIRCAKTHSPTSGHFRFILRRRDSNNRKLPNLPNTAPSRLNQGTRTTPQLPRRAIELIDSSRCCPAPPPVPRPSWSPAEDSTPRALACPRPTTTPRAPTATCPSTLAPNTSASPSSPSSSLASLPPSALLVRVLSDFSRPQLGLETNLSILAWQTFKPKK
jgi:hypothetical protein